MACRFLPGIRVPLYLSVGALTRRTKAFFWWTCFFAFVWTPALIALVVLLGDAFTRPFEYFTGEGWVSIVLGIIAIYLAVRGTMLMSTAEGRKTLARRFLWPFRGRGAAGGDDLDDLPGRAGAGRAASGSAAAAASAADREGAPPAAGKHLAAREGADGATP
jgi:uncharacterized integral membrane protein